MAGLGYSRYGAQGGDYGAFVAPDLGRVDPEHVVGAHVNAATFGFIPFDPLSDADRAGLTEVERARVDRLGTFLTELNGYFQVQATRPQTLAYGLTDSPAGQLAWIVEKFAEWTDAAHPLPEQAVDRDAMLTDVSLYWFTRTAGSAANLYYESVHNQAWPTPSTVPTGVCRVRPGRRHSALRRAPEPDRALVGLHHRRPLRRHGNAGPAGRRHPRLLRRTDG